MDKLFQDAQRDGKLIKVGDRLEALGQKLDQLWPPIGEVHFADLTHNFGHLRAQIGRHLQMGKWNLLIDLYAFRPNGVRDLKFLGYQRVRILGKNQKMLKILKKSFFYLFQPEKLWPAFLFSKDAGAKIIEKLGLVFL